MLGVLKVATTDQIQRIGAPRLSYRHTDKETPSEQKTARTASHTAALSDMRKHALAENGGSAETRERLRNLTAKGLEAASYELRRPVTERWGSTARGASASGASHPIAVNETVIAMLRPKPNVAKLADDPVEVRAAAQAVVDAPGGVGTIASYWTEVPLPAIGTWNALGKGGAQAAIVLTAPQDKVPLLFIEVDNCHALAQTTAPQARRPGALRESFSSTQLGCEPPHGLHEASPVDPRPDRVAEDTQASAQPCWQPLSSSLARRAWR
ncbi:hypothetical protein [Streptomyces sp. NPDC057557]|uniref:hypothetical protein n=1 Tax=Streptomyces sp. NPDC057557 TaxID=3346167 RepID=UPI0036D04EAF